jgi:hypothetical protein
MSGEQKPADVGVHGEIRELQLGLILSNFKEGSRADER